MGRREEELNKMLNEFINDKKNPFIDRNDALKNFYLGYIAVSLTAIADELHEMNKKHDDTEFLNFIFNHMNPNDMENYLSMYESGKENKNECNDSARI